MRLSTSSRARQVGRRTARLVALALVLATVTGCSADDFTRPVDSRPVGGPRLPAQARTAEVVRVIDGDTVELAGLGSVRLIGVDTPEVYGGVECYGREASAYVKRQLDGATVRFTIGRDDRDRYGRLLAYVWLEDGRSFNALLVARGYASPLTIPPNDDYARAFVALARRARERGAGLWAPEACGGP